MAFGLLAASLLSELPITFASLPHHPPASNLLHALAARKEFGVTTFQAEDEMAAVCAAIGASWAGGLGVTSSSGPGIALKTEAITYAATVELPLIVINTQRAGPSTAACRPRPSNRISTQAVFGAGGGRPAAGTRAAASPAECFEIAVEAARIATRYMTPVIVLSDALPRERLRALAHPGRLRPSAVPARVPHGPGWIPPVPPGPRHPGAPLGCGRAHRDSSHRARVGGIEKAYDSGNISYDPENHQRMTDVRTAKIDGIAADIPDQGLEAGEAGARLAVVGWGSTWGAIHQAVRRVRAEGLDVAPRPRPPHVAPSREPRDAAGAPSVRSSCRR